MRYFVKILALGLLVFGYTACGSSQKLVDHLPFTHGELRLEPWTVGETNTLKGVNIYIPVQEDSSSVVLDSLYYQGKVVQLESVKRDSYKVYIGRFMDSNPSNLILHADPRKEFGNKPPQGRVTPPYAIDNNEALLKYTMDGKVLYYKLSNLVPATAIHYNELPPSLRK